MLGKKISVYDSQIWYQQGRAFVRNSGHSLGEGGLQYEKKMGFLSQANLDVSHTFICPFELVCTKIRLHFAAI